MRYHDPQFNLTKLLALKERFLEHLKELSDDKGSAHHLVEELESGIQTLDPMHNPLYQLEQGTNYSHEDPVQLTRHHLKFLNEFSHEVSTIYEELSEKLSRIEYSLGMFIQILENKKASVEYLKAVQPIQSTQRINPRSTR